MMQEKKQNFDNIYNYYHCAPTIFPLVIKFIITSFYLLLSSYLTK